MQAYRQELEQQAESREEAFRELTRRNVELEEELERFKRRSRDDDDVRDRYLAEARRDLRELAERVARIAAPSIEASGAVGAKAVTDHVERSAKRREWVRDIVIGLALAGSVLWTMLRDKPVEPTANVPVPTVKPAGTNLGGRP